MTLYRHATPEQADRSCPRRWLDKAHGARMTLTTLDLVLLVLAFFFAVMWWCASSRSSRRSRRRNAIAQAAEAGAEALLARHGYRVLDRQVRSTFELLVDGELVEVSCRADLLVERRGRTFIAECKSGRLAPDPTLPATRRQLLEYLLAFDTDGVLLVDMTAGVVHTVSWPSDQT